MKYGSLVPRALTVFLLAAPAAAQQARDDGGAARLQGMVQQLTAERTEIQADNTRLKTELDAANAELRKLRDDNARLERNLGANEVSLNRATASNDRNAALVEQQRARTEELVVQFRQTIETLRATELERNELRTTLAARESTLNQCAANNQKLFETGNEVLDRYEQKGCWSALRDNEPFTRNKRVQLENLIDEYRWALEDQRLPETEPAVTGASDAAGS